MEEGSGWGTRVYLWQIHVDIWQNQYNIVKLKSKIKLKKKNMEKKFIKRYQSTEPDEEMALTLANWEIDAFISSLGKTKKTRELGNRLEKNYPE